VQYHGGVMTAHDQIAYQNSPILSTHPGRLFAKAKLAGLRPVPEDRCRVLELGSNAGENLIAMAVALPSAEFVGVELAEKPVRRGRQTIAALGLTNIRLERMDVLEIGADFGRFDYIIAHGLYSWTPPAARDRILAVARRHMGPQGVTLVSYNTFPGSHLRMMQREMLLHYLANEENPRRRLDRAREFLKVLAMGRPEMDTLEAAVAAQAEETAERTDSALYHDDLCDHFEPVYFHQFVAHAARHDLQYLGDASIMDSLPQNLAPETMAAVKEMAAGDRLAEQQYLDFVRTRRFRRTLLCHAEVNLGEGSAEGCHASSYAREKEDGVFISKSGLRMTTTHPAPIGYLRRLSSLLPHSEPVSAGDAALALDFYKMGMIELRGSPSAARAAGEKPCVSAFARLQVERGDQQVTSLGHLSVEIADESARKLLQLLDGTRDREQLCRELRCSAEHLEQGLSHLARCELLAG